MVPLREFFLFLACTLKRCPNKVALKNAPYREDPGAEKCFCHCSTFNFFYRIHITRREKDINASAERGCYSHYSKCGYKRCTLKEECGFSERVRIANKPKKPTYHEMANKLSVWNDDKQEFEELE